MKKTKKGFTLIELIVVLAILAIVAVIAVPTAFSSIEKARVAADKATMESVNSAIRVYAAVGMADKDFIKTAPNVNTALADGGLPNITAITWQSTAGLTHLEWVPGTKTGDLGHFKWVDTAGTAPTGTEAIFKAA